ncbi:VOC family protein [Tabrizicola sp. J26]|uniref:VOC family protein n=1 Tax=Alitabrizicola rongguiensis TaxID=2909234 RepID=UPI001F1CDC74|nr:VOC family protein [Tabrizicola rongguiensis]MCF1710876.1 VOC family protein [Tabrizicola rongguiensis]
MTEPSPSPRLGPVDLRVTDVERSAEFWQTIVGLTRLPGEGAILGLPGRPLIRLHPGATGPMPDMALGLFHIALQVPASADLAQAAVRFAASGLRHSGQDHLLSRSVYIADPDGNKIEVTHLTPGRGTIRAVDGRVEGLTRDGVPHSIFEPLDLAELRAEVASGERQAKMPDGTINGHIHFRTRDLAAAYDFYRLVGLMPNIFAPANHFGDLGRVDHPHLVALNTWAGDRLIPAPPGAAGIIAYVLELPDPDRAASRLRRAGVSLTATASGFDCADRDGNLVRVIAAP